MDDLFNMLDATLFYNGWEVFTLMRPLLRDFDMDEKQAREVVELWAEDRDYVIKSIDVVESS